MLEANKAVARRFCTEGVQDTGLWDQLLHPDYLLHYAGVPGGLIRGADAARQLHLVYLAAFPDLQATIEDVVAEGDRVVVRSTYEGTHNGELQGAPPTGRRVRVGGTSVFRLSGGRIAEEWAEVDTLGLMQQVGLLPPPAAQDS